MTVPQRISIVTLAVADLERSVAFYRSLGWRRAPSSASIAFFQMQGSVLALYERGALADDAHQSPEGSGFRGVTLALNVESPEAVEVVYAAWIAAGARPVVEPHTASWGGHSSYVADPDGHLWEIAHAPGAVIDADGRLVVDEADTSGGA
jgi:catechol 2,3-dioxygenase-like lactoylglutathione lyase family enzyme